MVVLPKKSQIMEVVGSAYKVVKLSLQHVLPDNLPEILYRLSLRTQGSLVKTHKKFVFFENSDVHGIMDSFVEVVDLELVARVQMLAATILGHHLNKVSVDFQVILNSQLQPEIEELDNFAV